ncbi:MAG: redox-sensing transcriptional repressor Rex [Anaerolineae bacterium]|nr:redox-sensing transcriptional repressor Rex [Anaerolineae bacterium]
MARFEKVPDIVIGRLPVYLRALTRLASEGQEITSSQQLGKMLGVSSAQIRKDLSYFGEFGKQGMGYNIAHLQEQLSAILKVDREWEVVVVGAGPLAEALIREDPFAGKGFRIVALFDSRPERIGQRLAGMEILDSAQLPEVVRQRGLKVAILAVPAAEAQQVADTLVAAGIKAILSYASTTLSVPPEVRLQYNDAAAQLQRMAYYLQ